MSDRRVNERFKVVIGRLTKGQSLRGISRRAGISHTYVDDLRWGIVPSYRTLQQFCKAMGFSPEETRELFDAADYQPLEDEESSAPSAPALFYDGLLTIQRDFPSIPLFVPRLHLGSRELTPELAEGILADIRLFMEEQAKEAAAEEASPKE